MMRAIRIAGVRRTVGVGLVALLMLMLGALVVSTLNRTARAEAMEGRAPAAANLVAADGLLVTPVEVGSEPESTELTVEGVGTRHVGYDGAVARFTVSVLRPSLLAAVSDGNETVRAIATEVEKRCTEGEPESADHTAPATCISPRGLQTVGINIAEEFDWTEQGRVSKGFRYENRLSIAIRGTGFAGGLVDMVITSGANDVRFDGLDFTVSRRAEVERLALLDAIDHALSTARAIADHMDYEIVRIVAVTPGTGAVPYEARRVLTEEAAAADSSPVPTPVFGGAEAVTSRVTMVFELRPLTEAEA